MPMNIVYLRPQFTSSAFFSFCWNSLYFLYPCHWRWHPRLSGQDWHLPSPCCCSQALSKCICPCVLLPESAHSHAQPESLLICSCLWATFPGGLDHCCPDGVRVSEPETWEVQLPVRSRSLGPRETCGPWRPVRRGMCRQGPPSWLSELQLHGLLCDWYLMVTNVEFMLACATLRKPRFPN